MSRKEKVFCISVSLFFIWIIASYINTIVHNSNDYEYAEWNAFVLFYKLVEVVQ